MDFWKINAPLGWKFAPTDAELLWGYLNPELGTGGGRCEGSIKFSDQVYKKPPWEYCTDSTALPGALPGEKKHYFFTKLEEMKKKKKKNQNQNQNQNRAIRTVASYGTWHESYSDDIVWEDDSFMGFKKLFNFKEKVDKKWKATDWLMHEFSVPGNILVLCVIQKKKGKKNISKRKKKTKKAHDDQVLDSEEEETRPSKKMLPDAKFDDNPFSGAPAPAPALDSEEEETRPSKEMQPDPKFDDNPFSGGDLCPAHDDDFQLQAFATSLLPGVSETWDEESGLLDFSGLCDDVPGLPDAVFGLPDDDFFDF